MRWGEYSLHFTGEETEAPGGQAACPSPLSDGKTELALNLPYGAPESRNVLVCKPNV